MNSIWKPYLRWDNFGVTFSDNSVDPRARRAFQVSQGSVETLFRWGGKTFTECCRNFIQETVYQISSESPEFYGRYYKKHFGLFFWIHLCRIFRVMRTMSSDAEVAWTMASICLLSDTSYTGIVRCVAAAASCYCKPNLIRHANTCSVYRTT